MPAAFVDSVMDGTLDKLAAATLMIACSAQPTNYTEATATFALADVVLAGGDWTKADDTSGRKITRAAKNSVTVDTSGTATFVAYVTTVGSVFLGSVPCTSTVLTGGGGTVNFGAAKINIQDPT